MTANPPGQSGGYTASSGNATAGFDTLIKFKNNKNMVRRHPLKSVKDVLNN